MIIDGKQVNDHHSRINNKDSKEGSSSSNSSSSSSRHNDDSDKENAGLITRQQVPLTQLASPLSTLVLLSRFRSNVVFTSCWLMRSTAQILFL